MMDNVEVTYADDSKRDNDLQIQNIPAYAADYEFIVARQDNNKFWFWGAWTDGWKADQVAHEVGGVVFHNVKIQGKRK